jgi:hypothetical protein
VVERCPRMSSPDDIVNLDVHGHVDLSPVAVDAFTMHAAVGRAGKLRLGTVLGLKLRVRVTCRKGQAWSVLVPCQASFDECSRTSSDQTRTRQIRADRALVEEVVDKGYRLSPCQSPFARPPLLSIGNEEPSSTDRRRSRSAEWPIFRRSAATGRGLVTRGWCSRDLAQSRERPPGCGLRPQAWR